MRRAAILIFFAILALGAAGSVAAQTANTFAFANFTNDPLYDQGTYQALRDITIDVPRENNVDLKTALRDVTLATIKADPGDDQLIFRFESAASPTDRERKVSLPRGRTSIYSVLLSLGQQASFDIKVRSGVVYIVPRAMK
jgi:hypothetical protein